VARLAAEDQLGMDEELIENPDVEAALVERQARKDALGGVRKDFNKAHEKVVAALASIELPEEGAVRVGRFRISKSLVSARSVSFETQESSRLRITLLGDETPRSRSSNRNIPQRNSTSDDADLRPTGEVNVDALRGAAARASTEPTPFRPRKAN
jgi:hypothetical protein